MSIKTIHNTKQFSQIVEDKEIYIGVDVHKRTYSVACLCPEKQLMLKYSTTSTNGDFVDEIKELNLNIKELVYEAGPTGFSLAWACQNSCNIDEQSGDILAAPLPVRVIAPLFAPQAVVKGNKNDSRDAMQLANLATKPLDLDSCSIAIPSLSEQNLKELSRLRELAADLKRKAIQRLKSLLLRYGIPFPSENGQYTKTVGEQLKNLDVSEDLKYLISDYVDKVEACIKDKEKQEAKLDDAIRNVYPEEQKILESIPGVGPIVTNTILGEVFRLTDRFSDKDQLAQYCGATPIIRESGETSGKIKGHLIQFCNVHVQPLLVQAAWTFMRCDEIANALYKRKVASGKPSGTAIMSVVKKLVSLIFSLLKNKRMYEVRSSN